MNTNAYVTCYACERSATYTKSLDEVADIKCTLKIVGCPAVGNICGSFKLSENNIDVHESHESYDEDFDQEQLQEIVM